MRIKPLLIVSAAAAAIALPAIAQVVAQTAPAANQFPNGGIGAVQPQPQPSATSPALSSDNSGAGDETAVEEIAPVQLQPSEARSAADRISRLGATRSAASGQARSRRAGPRKQPLGRCERRLPVDFNAADGRADRFEVGAYRTSRHSARKGGGAARCKPDRLGCRARLAAPAHGRSGRRAHARRRCRYGSLHSENGAGRCPVRACECRRCSIVSDRKRHSEIRPADCSVRPGNVRRFGRRFRDRVAADR